MSLTMEQRMKLANEASRDRAFARLREADRNLSDGISWVLCDCKTCEAQRSWMRMQIARRKDGHRARARVAALVVAASVLAIFLLLKGLPILKALNY